MSVSIRNQTLYIDSMRIGLGLGIDTDRTEVTSWDRQDWGEQQCEAPGMLSLFSISPEGPKV